MLYRYNEPYYYRRRRQRPPAEPEVAFQPVEDVPEKSARSPEAGTSARANPARQLENPTEKFRENQEDRYQEHAGPFSDNKTSESRKTSGESLWHRSKPTYGKNQGILQLPFLYQTDGGNPAPFVSIGPRYKDDYVLRIGKLGFDIDDLILIGIIALLLLERYDDELFILILVFLFIAGKR